MTEIIAVQGNRRSLLLHQHRAAAAHFRTWQNQTMVAHYAESANEEKSWVRQLAVCDLSTLDRCGFKGSETPAWLEEQGLQLPSNPNQAIRCEKTGLIARLSNEEHLFLTAPFVETPRASLYGVGEVQGRRVYTLPRQDSHAWLYLCGELAPEMMSFVCAVDLHLTRFAQFNVAQTSVAKLNAVVVRQDLGRIPGFHLLCDQPSVAYWWEALLDAAMPLDGHAVGVDALLALHQS